MAAPQVARFGELIRRLFSTKGYAEANVLEDYFPSIDLFVGKAEIYKLRDEQLFNVGGRGLGAAAQNGRVWCMNKKPGSLAIVEQLVIGLNAAAPAQVLIDFTTIGLPADGAGGQSVAHSMDSRYGTGIPGTTPGSPVSVANDAAGVTAGVPLMEQPTAAQALVVPCRYVLKNGYALVVSISAQGVGANFTVSFQGYWRAVEDSELK